LGSVENGRGPVAFGDGSVRVLPENLAARVFRLLVLMNDGQPVPVGDF
jgi:prepilin-type processing-associated H-X9-DG protein